MILELEHVSFGYIKQPLLLTDVCLQADCGTLLVFGQKGVGKTSLLELLCGIQDLYVGKISVCGNPPKESTINISYLPSKLVALENKTVMQNLKYACDAIYKDYSSINQDDDWIKAFAQTKLKTLSNFQKAIFALKRAQIKDGQLLLIDVNLENFTDQEIQEYSEILNKIIDQKNKLVVIATNCEDYKKLQINADKSEICYIFASKVQKFSSMQDYSKDVPFMGMAEYLPLNKYDCQMILTQNGYHILNKQRVIKIKEKFVEKIESYFDDATNSTNICFFTNLNIESISDEEFNNAVETGDILLYDSLTTERLI